MTTAQLVKNKREAKKKMKETLHLPKSGTYICAISVANKTIEEFICNGLKALNIGCVPVDGNISENQIAGFDFFISDSDTGTINIIEYMRKGVVPIISTKNTLSGVLTHFDPMNFSGNSFLYEKEDPYLIFASIIQFIENCKFPADKRTLIKNVMETF